MQVACGCGYMFTNVNDPVRDIIKRKLSRYSICYVFNVFVIGLDVRLCKKHKTDESTHLLDALHVSFFCIGVEKCYVSVGPRFDSCSVHHCEDVFCAFNVTALLDTRRKCFQVFLSSKTLKCRLRNVQCQTVSLTLSGRGLLPGSWKQLLWLPDLCSSWNPKLCLKNNIGLTVKRQQFVYWLKAYSLAQMKD